MSVLLFRPEAKVQESCDAFFARGIEAKGVALIRTVENTPQLETLSSSLSESPPGSKAIFVSTTAAQLAIKAVEIWPKHLETISIGQSTASVLKAGGIDPIVPNVETSEGLLETTALQSIEQCNVYLIKGVGGRRSLKLQLAKRGAKCIDLDLYYRQRVLSPVSTTPWKADDIECIIATSGELIEAAFEQYDKDWLTGIPWIVVSQRTADIASKLGIRRTHISNGANIVALIEATQKLLER